MKEKETGLCPSLQSLNASPGLGWGGVGGNHVLVLPHPCCDPGPTPLPLTTQIANRPQQHALRAESEYPGNPTDFWFRQFLETFYCLLLLSDK